MVWWTWFAPYSNLVTCILSYAILSSVMVVWNPHTEIAEIENVLQWFGEHDYHHMQDHYAVMKNPLCMWASIKMATNPKIRMRFVTRWYKTQLLDLCFMNPIKSVNKHLNHTQEVLWNRHASGKTKKQRPPYHENAFVVRVVWIP